MSRSREEQFEQSFQQAVSATLQAGQASDGLRARLLQVLGQATDQAPGEFSLEQCDDFHQALSGAVERSQNWAADDQVAHRVETAVGQEVGRDVLSERSLHACPDQSAKSRYLDGLRASVARSQQAQVAPESCRQRILKALKAERASKVTSLPSRSSSSASTSRWKRMLIGTGSVAAGFALLMGTLMGGAEKALADSVRQDHQRCCSAMKGHQMKRCASLEDSDFGPLPTATVAAGWDLVASKICHDGNGKPMIHNVYANDKKTISLHFWPPQSKATQAKTQAPRQIAGDGFPVLAWDAQGWTITACSDDIDSGTLAAVVRGQ